MISPRIGKVTAEINLVKWQDNGENLAEIAKHLYLVKNGWYVESLSVDGNTIKVIAVFESETAFRQKHNMAMNSLRIVIDKVKGKG